MTRTTRWVFALLVAGCGDVNADVVFTKNPEPERPSTATTPASESDAGGQTESDAGDRTDKGRDHLECRIDEDCTRGENPRCVAGQCVH